MGMEADCRCRWSGGEARVKALLEARELILRGDVRRTLAIGAIKTVALDGDDLIVAADETYALNLGAARAARWKAKIETPPPTLAAKLGLAPGATAYVIGELEDANLRAAVEGARGAAVEAKVCIAEVASEAALIAALDGYEHEAADQPLWIVHGKGAEGGVRRQRGARRDARARFHRQQVVRGIGGPLDDAVRSPLGVSPWAGCRSGRAGVRPGLQAPCRAAGPWTWPCPESAGCRAPPEAGRR